MHETEATLLFAILSIPVFLRTALRIQPWRSHYTVRWMSAYL